MRFFSIPSAGASALLALFLSAISISLPGCSNNLGQSQIATGSLSPDAPPSAPPRSAMAPAASPEPAPGGDRLNGSQGRIGGGTPPAVNLRIQPRSQLNWQASPQAPAPRPTIPARTAAGQSIEVQPGETLYTISKRHGVSIASLVDTNHLGGVSISAGQRLVLPQVSR